MFHFILVFFHFLKTSIPFLPCFVWPFLCYNVSLPPFSSWYVTLPGNLQIPSWVWLGFHGRSGYRINIFRKEPKLRWHCSLHHSAHELFEMCGRTQILTWSKHWSSRAITYLVFLSKYFLSVFWPVSVSQIFSGSSQRPHPSPHCPPASCSVTVYKCYSDLDVKLCASLFSSLCCLDRYSEFLSDIIFQNSILLF